MIGRVKHVSKFSDLKLVECVLNGQTEAYSELVRRHQASIFQMTFNWARSSDDADDLAQMVFLKAYRSLHLFQGKAQFSTWLYRICMNCCCDWTKTRKKWEKEVGYDAWWAQLSADDVLFGHEIATDQWVIDREIQEALDHALKDLAPEFRTVVVLREINGLSYGEIAEVVGCEEGTVKSRLFRARAQLRKLLKPMCQEWQVA